MRVPNPWAVDLRRPVSRVGDGELQGFPLERKLIRQEGRRADDVRHQLIDDQSQRNGHVRGHIHALDSRS